MKIHTSETRKEIGYAYPTSPDACDFGFKNTGCYTVALVERGAPPKTLKAFADKASAKTYAETVPCVYSIYSI